MGQPVVHFEIGARNEKKAYQFYTDLFGWKIDAEKMPGYGLVSNEGDRSIGGGIFKATAEMPPYVTIYVMVDDLQAYLDKAVKLGGSIVVPPTPIPGVGAFAMFKDLDGNCLGLFRQG